GWMGPGAVLPLAGVTGELDARLRDPVEQLGAVLGDPARRHAAGRHLRLAWPGGTGHELPDPHRRRDHVQRLAVEPDVRRRGARSLLQASPRELDILGVRGAGPRRGSGRFLGELPDWASHVSHRRLERWGLAPGLGVRPMRVEMFAGSGWLRAAIVALAAA